MNAIQEYANPSFVNYKCQHTERIVWGGVKERNSLFLLTIILIKIKIDNEKKLLENIFENNIELRKYKI